MTDASNQRRLGFLHGSAAILFGVLAFLMPKISSRRNPQFLIKEDTS